MRHSIGSTHPPRWPSFPPSLKQFASQADKAAPAGEPSTHRSAPAATIHSDGWKPARQQRERNAGVDWCGRSGYSWIWRGTIIRMTSSCCSINAIAISGSSHFFLYYSTLQWPSCVKTARDASHGRRTVIQLRQPTTQVHDKNRTGVRSGVGQVLGQVHLLKLRQSGGQSRPRRHAVNTPLRPPCHNPLW